MTSFSKLMIPLAVFAVGFGSAALVCRQRPADQPPPRGADCDERSMIIYNVPDPTSPTGVRILRLEVARVAGGPEGTVTYTPRPTDANGLIVIDHRRDVVVTVGPRTYVTTRRD